MAIFHLSVKTVSRSAGRSATAAAAYRTGEKIVDERTGEIHNYTRKGGVMSAELVLPPGAPDWAAERAALWNAAESAETRKNSTVAREFVIALPSELSDAERVQMAHDFARELVERHRFAADVAIHAPGKEGDHRNFHAHILVSTRRLTADGFTEKTRELDNQRSGEVVRWRERFAQLQNVHLERAGVDGRVDHRSLKDQGVEREPTRHLGVAAVGYERRTGQPSDVRMRIEREVTERLLRAKLDGEREREANKAEKGADQRVLDLSNDLARALADRDAADREAARLIARQVAGQFKADLAAKQQAAEQVRLAKQEQDREVARRHAREVTERFKAEQAKKQAEAQRQREREQVKAAQERERVRERSRGRGRGR